MAGVWRKTLIYLGLAEEDEEYEDYAYDDLESPEEPPRRRAAAGGGRRTSVAEARAPHRVEAK